MFMSIVRLEKFGDTYRLVKFLCSPIRKNKRSAPTVHTKVMSEEDFVDFCYEEEEYKERLRFDSSITRSRSRVRELALCNKWEYFCTLTLCDEKQDRFELRQFTHDLGNWIGNYNRTFSCKLRYLIIPEQHKNGAWHAHGLLDGISPDSLVLNEHGYLDLPYYRKRFGYISLSPVKDKQKCASYITKYITKDIDTISSIVGSHNHLFYASRGLKGREVVCQTSLYDFEPDYVNEFVGIKYLNEYEAVCVLEDFKYLM